MRRLFGERVECKFVDAGSSEVEAFPKVAEGLRRGRLRPPVVIIGGSARYHGIFSPTFIQRDVKALLGGEAAAKPGRREAERRRLEVVGRPGFSTSVVRSKG